MFKKLKSGELKKEIGQAVVEYVVVLSIMSVAAFALVDVIGEAVDERGLKVQKEVERSYGNDDVFNSIDVEVKTVIDE